MSQGVECYSCLPKTAWPPTSVIGFDDIQIAQYTNPSLTTVKKPIEKISRLGAEKILESVESNEQIGEKIFVETELIKRKSVSSRK